MVTRTIDGLLIVQSDLLLAAGVSHGWFGVSLGNTIFREDNPYNDPEFVPKEVMNARRARACRALQLDPDRLVVASGLEQTDVVQKIGAAQAGQVAGPADGYITDEPGMPILLGAADCLQVVLYDPVRHCMGVVHAGGVGLVRGVLAETVRQMARQFATDPKDIIAAIGPSIAVGHYIPANGIESYAAVEGAIASPIGVRLADGKIGYDIAATGRKQLEDAGVLPDHIEISKIDTFSSPDFYSWRREKHRNIAAGKRRHGLFAALPAASQKAL